MQQSYPIPSIDGEVLEALKSKGFYTHNKFGPFEKWDTSKKSLTHVDFEFANGKIIHYIFEQLTFGKEPLGAFLSKDEVVNKIKEL